MHHLSGVDNMEHKWPLKAVKFILRPLKCAKINLPGRDNLWPQPPHFWQFNVFLNSQSDFYHKIN